MVELDRVVCRHGGLHRVGICHDGRVEDALDAHDGVLGFGERLRGVHHLRHHHGCKRGKHDVEQEVGEKRREIPRIPRNQDARRYEHGERAVDRHELRHLRRRAEAHVRACELAVGAYRLPESGKRAHRLLKHLHDGDSAHVLDRPLVHAVERILVVLHERHHARVLVVSAAGHHPEHARGGHDDGHEAQQPHHPVDCEHNDEIRYGRGKRTHEVGETMREHTLGETGRALDDSAQLACGVRVEVSERRT